MKKIPIGFQGKSGVILIKKRESIHRWNEECVFLISTLTANIIVAFKTHTLTHTHTRTWCVTGTCFVDADFVSCLLQEPTSEKTNNGIHYKLQLLYSNGE